MLSAWIIFFLLWDPFYYIWALLYLIKIPVISIWLIFGLLVKRSHICLNKAWIVSGSGNSSQISKAVFCWKLCSWLTCSWQCWLSKGFLLFPWKVQTSFPCAAWWTSCVKGSRWGSMWRMLKPIPEKKKKTYDLSPVSHGMAVLELTESLLLLLGTPCMVYLALSLLWGW